MRDLLAEPGQGVTMRLKPPRTQVGFRRAPVVGRLQAPLTVRFGRQEHTELQIEKAVVDHSQARKEQVQAMVARLLALPGLGPARTSPTRSASRSAMPMPAPRPQRSRAAARWRKAHAQFRKGRSY